MTEREPAAWGFGLEEELGLSDAVIDQVPIFLVTTRLLQGNR